MHTVAMISGFLNAHILMRDSVCYQASAAELRVALQQRGAMELEGTWRTVAPAHLAALLEVLLLSATQHSWHHDAVPVQEACSVLQADGFDPRFLP